MSSVTSVASGCVGLVSSASSVCRSVCCSRLGIEEGVLQRKMPRGQQQRGTQRGDCLLVRGCFGGRINPMSKGCGCDAFWHAIERAMPITRRHTKGETENKIRRQTLRSPIGSLARKAKKSWKNEGHLLVSLLPPCHLHFLLRVLGRMIFGDLQ